MFYAHFVLAKKGPLAKIWLAAHWDKKLTKAHVFETNIEKSVDGILKPKVKMALRTSGHLLLGVVRIYSRKAKYLLQDCNEAFVKIKMAFRPGMVDLPEEHREAAMNAITLPEVFHDFDTAMPELNEVDIEAQYSLNQSRAEEITMREDYGSLNLVTHDDGFGDMGFDTDNPDIMRDAIGNEGGLEQSNLLFAEGSSLDLAKDGSGTGARGPQLSESHVPRMEAAPQHIDDGFGGPIPDVGDFGHAGGLFEGDLFGEVSASGTGGAASSGAGHSVHAHDTHDAQPQSLQIQNGQEITRFGINYLCKNRSVTKTKRKRKLIVDEVKNISGEEMKNQLSNTADIVTTLDLAPPTRRLMHWKESGGVEKLSIGTPLTPSMLGSLTPGTLLQGGLSLDTVGLNLGLPHGGLTPANLHHAGMTPGGLDHGGMTPVHGGMTPAHGGMTPAHGGMTPAHGGMTPAGLHHGGMTPAGLQHGGMTPAGLQHGGMTPAGLQHGGMTPAGLQHGGMTPAGLQHGGMTPAGLQHGGMTPSGLQHGGITPAGLQHGGMTPTGLQHGGMTPAGLQHGSMTPAGLQHGGMTPAGLAHGGMTPLGYDDQQGHQSPQHDYDLPLSVDNEAGREGEWREAGETEQQFEERVLNRRAEQLFSLMKPRGTKVLQFASVEETSNIEIGTEGNLWPDHHSQRRLFRVRSNINLYLVH
ncbi:unnamed protein product [Leptidea sinapis]|uniref:Rad21/Rec8-like protein N-terminal domain-containing protein n=1 Tax=Leptidea sinapis TaxID=189913 RepID=A0A5E4QA36_9NEOP|nr:unnamed protein product [Leptidea sinapis]